MSNTPVLANKREGFILKSLWPLSPSGKIHTPKSLLRSVSPAQWHIPDSQRLGQKNWLHDELCQRLGNHLSNVQMADKVLCRRALWVLASSIPAGNLLGLYGHLDKIAVHEFVMVSLLCQKTWSHNYLSIQTVFAPENGSTLQWVFLKRPWQHEMKMSDFSSSTQLSCIQMWFLLWLMPNPPGLSTVRCVLEGDLWASHSK